MSAPTPVDAAHAAMQAAGDDDAARRVWADAVLAASIFHFGTYSIPEAKQYMVEHGVPMRITAGGGIG